MTVSHLSEPIKHGLDALAGVALVGTLLSILPTATVILSFVWLAMRVFESFQNIKLNARKLRE